MKKGERVFTEHGEGIVVGRDLPNIKRLTRLIIKITNPKDKYIEMVSRFKNNELCYFSKEVSVIKA